MRKIVVTSALPYANGPIHIGHLVEYLQTDIWVRFQKLCGNECLYFCADDTHGTAIMIRARDEGISPEALISRVHEEHVRDFGAFGIEFDNYYSTHSDENRRLSEMIYTRALQDGAIVKEQIEQAYCPGCRMWLPDRYIRGVCPRCKAENQYGDSCDACGGTHEPTELINPVCSNCGKTPERRSSTHYFFRLAKYEGQLRELMASGYVGQSVMNKLEEWFSSGLKDWDISRDGPYFGFKIPGEEDKYFYVWLDAPIGYMASCRNYCDRNGLDFEEVWNGSGWELYHFIGKDIVYFHALFWPALLMAAGLKRANKLFVHGFLTVNGQKMSKSRGTFIRARTYADNLDPEYMRYYYASKLTGGVEDIDLSLDDFVAKVNSELVGKIANLASRSGVMITKNLGGILGKVDSEGRELIERLIAARESVIRDFERLDYASVIRTVVGCADECNRYFDKASPWKTIKTDPEAAETVLTAIANAVRILAIYLKPVLPGFAGKIERFLNVGPLGFSDVGMIPQGWRINDFVRLVERVEKEKVEAMVEQSKEQDVSQNKTEGDAGAGAADGDVVVGGLSEPIAPECTIEDFMKVDLRVARVVSAGPVAGADKLLELELDIGGVRKRVFAGIAQAYKPQELVGRLVICAANLAARRMRFGVSEGMILAAGTGGKDVFMLSIDNGAKPGERVH